jgi:two-component system chemotaxis response regulator CheY
MCETKMVTDSSMPVLVVDDSDTMFRIVRKLLNQIGLENVDHATDGQVALTKMHEKSYRLVVTDCNMQPMSGYELLREIRTDSRLTTTSILLMTADSGVARLVEETDTTQYLMKPFSAQALKSKIDGLLTGEVAQAIH